MNCPPLLILYLLVQKAIQMKALMEISGRQTILKSPNNLEFESSSVFQNRMILFSLSALEF